MPTKVAKGTSTTCDAQVLARGWRAVAAVAGTNSAIAALYHTVCVEQFEQGLRLTSTDSVRLLTAWVPASGYTPEEEPDLDELPSVTAVVIDQWGRAKSLLAHMSQQAAQEENDGLEAVVRLGVPWEPPDADKQALQFAGFDARAADIEYTGHERLHLPLFEGEFVPWRNLLGAWAPGITTALALQQDMLGVLAKASSPFGETCRIELRFQGEERPIAVAFGEEPKVRGLLMPMRWDFGKDAPEEPVEKA